MNCPKCDASVDNSNVVETRKVERGVVRTRKCECGLRYKTMELIDDKRFPLEIFLKPCPFCNSLDLGYVEDDDSKIAISCATCGATGPYVETTDGEVSNAVKIAWNTRRSA